jgi:prevent-host-death family protein
MFSPIGAFDAKTKLPELLRRVQRGQRFTITLRGKPVADLVPSGLAARRSPQQAIEEMLNFKRLKNVDPADIEEWIREGRR